jgi:hypothetical protein
MAAAKQISEKQKYALYDRFSAARLTSAQDAQNWYDIVAAEYGVTHSAVRRWIAEADEIYRQAARDAALTAAERTFAILGAARTQAIGVLLEQLAAKTSKVIHDRDGNVSQVLEFEDNQARIAAAREIMKLLGNYPAEGLNINPGSPSLDSLSDEELNARLAVLRSNKSPEGS